MVKAKDHEAVHHLAIGHARTTVEECRHRRSSMSTRCCELVSRSDQNLRHHPVSEQAGPKCTCDPHKQDHMHKLKIMFREPQYSGRGGTGVVSAPQWTGTFCPDNMVPSSIFSAILGFQRRRALSIRPLLSPGASLLLQTFLMHPAHAGHGAGCPFPTIHGCRPSTRHLAVL